jgi:hypothetical protein
LTRKRRTIGNLLLAGPCVVIRDYLELGMGMVEVEKDKPTSDKLDVVDVLVIHSYLVDPASSHMLVSKIKPCMSKYKHFIR